MNASTEAIWWGWGSCLYSSKRETLGLTGHETYDILGIADGLEPHERLRVIARREDGEEVSFQTIARLDSDVDVEYYRNEGILHTVLRRMGAGDM